MTESVLPRPSRFPWLVPLVIFVLVLAALIAALAFAREASKSEAPPQPAAFVPPSGRDYTAFDVERVDGAVVKVTTGTGRESTSLDLALPPGTRIWLLEPATAADLKPPLVVSVIAIPNEVRNYTIKLIAFAPTNGEVVFDGEPLALADEFLGHEVSRDPNERSVVSVLLESFDGRDGITRTSTGPGTLFVDDEAPIRLLRAGEPAEIKPGDRIAVHSDASGMPDVSRGVLVLTGGAR